MSAGRYTIRLRFAPWVEPYARLMGRIGGGPLFQQAVVSFVQAEGVRRVG